MSTIHKKRRLLKEVTETTTTFPNGSQIVKTVTKTIQPDGSVTIRTVTSEYIHQDDCDTSDGKDEEPQSLAENTSKPSTSATIGINEGFPKSCSDIPLVQELVSPPVRQSRSTSTVAEIVPIHLLYGKVFGEILSFLSCQESFCTIRPVSVMFREACMTDPRWLPVIAPPTLANEILELPRHWKDLCILYFKNLKWHTKWSDDYRVWTDAFEEWDDDSRMRAKRRLRSRRSNLDGFFSLAPWKHSSPAQSTAMSYPAPWLHTLVYGSPCPTKLRRSTLRMKSPNFSRSLFFQQRVRSDKKTQFRTFVSIPIHPHKICLDKIQRVILQPVNFRRHNDGMKHDRLPDHNEAHLHGLNDACKKILECYFGKNSVTISPVREHRANLTQERKGNSCGNCRINKEGLVDDIGLPVIQVSADALDRMPICDDNDEWKYDYSDEGHSETVFLIAPHMYCKDTNLDWCYSTQLDAHFQCVKPWVLSTFNFFDLQDDPQRLQCEFACLVVYSMLLQLEMMDVCDNKNCALNNADSVNEFKDSICMIPCPTCIRKLHLGGAIEDVPSFLSRLSNVLRQVPFVSCCPNDLAILKKCGYGA
ncbi:hypothetical protein ACHAW6_013782 [Cyclotella cf. meneghiniana]